MRKLRPGPARGVYGAGGEVETAPIDAPVDRSSADVSGQGPLRLPFPNDFDASGRANSLPVTASFVRTEALDTLSATAVGPTVDRSNADVSAQGPLRLPFPSDFNANRLSIGPVTATFTRTEANDTLNASAGGPGVDRSAADVSGVGALGVPFPSDFNANRASAGVTATLAATEANDTVAAQAVVPVVANLTRTQANQTLIATSGGGVMANLSRTQADQTLSSSAVQAVGATLAATEAADTVASSAVVPVTATCVRAEANDSLSSFAGTATIGPTATLAVTQASQALAASASSTVNASLARAQADQVAISVAKVPVIANLVARQDDQSLRLQFISLGHEGYDRIGSKFPVYYPSRIGSRQPPFGQRP